MCDYCGCHDAEPFAELAREHEALEELGSELRDALRSGAEDRARAQLTRIVEILGPHVRKEERGLFSLVLQEGGLYAEVTEDLIGEHVELERAIAHADDVPADWGSAALALLSALDDHIFKEEYDLFPAAQGLLGLGDLEVMAAVHVEEGSALHSVKA